MGNVTQTVGSCAASGAVDIVNYAQDYVVKNCQPVTPSKPADPTVIALGIGFGIVTAGLCCLVGYMCWTKKKKAIGQDDTRMHHGDIGLEQRDNDNRRGNGGESGGGNGDGGNRPQLPGHHNEAYEFD